MYFHFNLNSKASFKSGALERVGLLALLVPLRSPVGDTFGESCIGDIFERGRACAKGYA
jgi:hypothetical protein